MFMAYRSHGGGLRRSHDKHRRVPHDGYIIGQYHWLPRLTSLQVTRRRVIHWHRLCIVAKCGIRFELRSCAAAQGSICARFNCVGARCTSLSLECS